uniref:DC-STAMP domain containing 1 n=1 Tax=Paramormyrops kingsleyae TaxID=1676925 RepID=A0A3B3SWH7_9TELE
MSLTLVPTELEVLSERTLPVSAHRFLFGHPDQFPVARFVAGVAFGVFGGLFPQCSLEQKCVKYDSKMKDLLLTDCHCCYMLSSVDISGLCIIGAVISSYFRCSVLLMLPCMLSSHGRTYIMLLVLYAVYQGPVANIHRNVQDVAFSMGCNIDLQVEHNPVLLALWRLYHFVALVEVLKSNLLLQDHKDVLQDEAENVSRMFQNITEEIMGEYGYDTKDQKLPGTGNSTQEQCLTRKAPRHMHVLVSDVVQNGIIQCRNWFNSTWQKCMRDVQVPVINLILCVPLQLDFLCDVMKGIMIPWCRQEIPVDVNFGDVYDKLNDCINRLRGDFGASVVYKVEFVSSGTPCILISVTLLWQILDVFHGLLSCSFIFIFISAFSYARQYNRDICFDNMYITTYFRQIDARRRKAGKRYLLPLKKAEQPYLINPWRLCIHSCELKCTCIGLLLVTDWVLYRIFDIVRKYTLTEFSIHSSHHMEFGIGGQSMLAELLRKTFHAFNTSSNLEVKSSNKHCLPNPSALSWEEYLWIFSPLLVMAAMSCLQIYSNRLRRIIAAFYFPKREKKRTLFLYNLQIQRRISYLSIVRHSSSASHYSSSLSSPLHQVFSALLFMLEKLPLKLQRCCVCGGRQGRSQAVRCPEEVCEAVYCPQCWRDLGRRCFACIPYTHFGPEMPYDSHTYAE